MKQITERGKCSQNAEVRNFMTEETEKENTSLVETDLTFSNFDSTLEDNDISSYDYQNVCTVFFKLLKYIFL